MNKTLLVAALLFLSGMATATPHPEHIQQNQNRQLNSIYAYDAQGNFFGILFNDSSATALRTIDSFDQLDSETSWICQHYLVQEGALFRGLQGQPESEIQCFRLHLDAAQPQQNGEMNQTPLPPLLPGPNQTPNQTQAQQEPQTGIATVFYAQDQQGDYIAMLIDNQNRIAGRTGSVTSLEQLDQDALLACEYLLQQNATGGATNVRCFDYEGLQSRIQNGSIQYLENQIQQGQPQNETVNEGPSLPV